MKIVFKILAIVCVIIIGPIDLVVIMSSLIILGIIGALNGAK